MQLFVNKIMITMIWNQLQWIGTKIYVKNGMQCG